MRPGTSRHCTWRPHCSSSGHASRRKLSGTTSPTGHLRERADTLGRDSDDLISCQRIVPSENCFLWEHNEQSCSDLGRRVCVPLTVGRDPTCECRQTLLEPLNDPVHRTARPRSMRLQLVDGARCPAESSSRVPGSLGQAKVSTSGPDCSRRTSSSMRMPTPRNLGATFVSVSGM